MVRSLALLAYFPALCFDGALGAADLEATVARLLAENAQLQKKLKAAESTCTSNTANSTTLPWSAQTSSAQLREKVVLGNRSRFLSSEHSEVSSKATPEGEEGHAEGAEHHSEEEGSHHHTEEEVPCYGLHAKDCTPKEKAKEIQKMMPEFLLAVMVMGNIVSMSALILLTKWKDADVRKSVYRMISTFLSIFCAIFINKFMCDFIIYQVLPCPPPFMFYKGGFGIKSSHAVPTPAHHCGEAPHFWAIGIFSLLFFIYHFTCTYLMHQARPSSNSWLRNKKTVFYISATIGGHLRGFAGVAVFGILQQVYFDHDIIQVFSCVLAAWAFFIVMRLVTHVYRRNVVESDRTAKEQKKDNKGNPEKQRLLTNIEHTDSLESGTKHPPWSKKVIESEDESTAVCIGFLAMQVVCFLCFDTIPPVEEEDDMVLDKRQRHKMLLYEGVLLGGIISVLLFRKYGCARCVGVDEHQDTCLPRFIKSLQRVLAMSLSWTVFKHGNWFWRELANDLFNPEVEGGRLEEPPPESIIIIGIIFNACWLTAICLVALLIFDFLGDIEEEVMADLKTKSPEEAHFSATCGIVWDCIKKGFPKLMASLDPGIFGYCCSCCKPVSKLRAISEIIKQDVRRDLAFNVNRDIINRNLSESSTPEEEDDEEEDDEEGIFRELIEALGFLIGICWEKAFSEANNVFTSAFLDLTSLLDKDKFSEVHVLIGPAISFTERHPLVFKYYVAIFMLVVVMVTWVKYLVPYARIGTAMHNYLQAAEDFGCNLMNGRKTRAVANNVLRQFATTPQYQEVLICRTCPKASDGTPQFFTFTNEGLGKVKCTGVNCTAAAFDVCEEDVKRSNAR